MTKVTLGDLLHEAPMDLQWSPDARRVVVAGVADDSRQVCPGDVFFALPGLRTDGGEFVHQAIELGAAAIVGDASIGPVSVPVVVCEDPVRLVGFAADRLHGHPSHHMDMVGITGTNGKTTTAFALDAILSAAGHTVGMQGTIVRRIGSKDVPSRFTTPGAVQLQKSLGEMLRAGCTSAILEVSSHGLQLGRLEGTQFDVAAFSHISQDHLDLHGTMEAYLRAKLSLFERYLRSGGSAVVNVDGRGSEDVIRVTRERGSMRIIRCSRVSTPSDVDLRARVTRNDLRGIEFELSANPSFVGGVPVRIRSALIGLHNVDNLLLAAACSLALGTDLDTAARGAAMLPGVPGRLQRVSADEDDRVAFVDYAHTPDALRRVLNTLRPLCAGRLIVVFGCGGERDRDKRPKMGRAAAEVADRIILTSDNPRGEDPLAIIADVEEGLIGTGIGLNEGPTHRGYLVHPERDKAIRLAVSEMHEGDVLLVAGKGHETSQTIGAETRVFDDREHLQNALTAG